jgi:hypothetical protein
VFYSLHRDQPKPGVPELRHLSRVQDRRSMTIFNRCSLFDSFAQSHILARERFSRSPDHQSLDPDQSAQIIKMTEEIPLDIDGYASEYTGRAILAYADSERCVY